MPEHQKMQQSGKSDSTFQKQAALASQTQVSHPASIIQRARIDPKSLTAADVLQLQRTIGNRAVGRLLSEIRNTSKVQEVPIQRQEVPEEEKEPLQGMFGKKPEEEACPSCMQKQKIPEEEETLQGKFETIQRLEPEEEEKLQMKSVVQRQEISEEEEPLQGKMAEPVQRQEIQEEEETLQGKMIGTIQRQDIPEEEPLQTKSENNTGMPYNLKAGVESLSGIDMSDVKVHYNSDKPSHVGALAYTQGTNIHVAPGQERHLPHEAWHVVQQVQGRVRPTMQTKGVSINNDATLEREADAMGEKAQSTSVSSYEIFQRRNSKTNLLGTKRLLLKTIQCQIVKVEYIFDPESGFGIGTKKDILETSGLANCIAVVAWTDDCSLAIMKHYDTTNACSGAEPDPISGDNALLFDSTKLTELRTTLTQKILDRFPNAKVQFTIGLGSIWSNVSQEDAKWKSRHNLIKAIISAFGVEPIVSGETIRFNVSSATMQ